MAQIDQALEERIRTELHERADDLFTDTIASMFGDQEAIKKAMIDRLLNEHATILAKVLGMENDPFNKGFRITNSGNARGIVGALAPLEQIAQTAVEELVRDHSGLPDIKARVEKMLKKNEQQIVDQLVSRCVYRLQSEVEAKVNTLISENATRIATDMFANLSVLQEDRQKREEAKRKLAYERNERRRQKREADRLAGARPTGPI